ncbi:hypothetical protein EW026_g1416 [Hermanssonia centrifuga]|uniref:Non-structural maintenance of chromosomes element 1 homolog n=1 Tax=Hermanssonia centrifuga TaxID=98765 RepID=A0A4S4KRY5_9APHY|nr:hypothetical protein EW026_g1416 [Hermanssonia centrifuga]
MFDFMDGKIARWRGESSMLGQELDSLADLISFGVAPALLAFDVGLRTYLDTVVLTGFICCGLARLARFNATVALVPKDIKGKAQYFEGLPIPSSLGFVSVLMYWTKQDWIEGKAGIPGGTITLWGRPGGDGDLHLVSIVLAFWAAAMVSKNVAGSKDLEGKLWMTDGRYPSALLVNQTLDIEYNDDRTSWDDWVTKLNTSLNPLDLEFAHLFDETSGKDMYALVNRKGDQVAQMATEYTAAEIAYFKGVLEQIMLAPNESYCVSSLAALREVNSLKTNMTKTQAESVLGSFVAKDATRTALPATKIGRQRQTRKKVFPIGEDAFKDGQDKGKRRTRRVAEGSDEEESQMDMDEDASQQTQTQQPTQTQGRSKKGKKKATQDDDMTVDEDEEDATPPPRTQKRKGRR